MGVLMQDNPFSSGAFDPLISFLHVTALDRCPGNSVRGLLLPRIAHVCIEDIIEGRAVNVLRMFREVAANRSGQLEVVAVRHRCCSYVSETRPRWSPGKSVRPWVELNPKMVRRSFSAPGPDSIHFTETRPKRRASANPRARTDKCRALLSAPRYVSDAPPRSHRTRCTRRTGSAAPLRSSDSGAPFRVGRSRRWRARAAAA